MENRLRVLLVDDEESYVNIVSLGLSEDNEFDVSVAESGREAIGMMETSKIGFDVIVLDYRMPGMSGLDVLRWMKENNVETPSFMLTAAGSESVAVDAMKLGAYDYCRKEDTDLPHLAHLIRATHERHLFRISESLEEERGIQMKLDSAATDKAQEAINAIAPALNSAFANISADLEMGEDDLCEGLPEDMKLQLKEMMGGLRRELGRIEHAVQGLLSLYSVLYARHPEAGEIDRIREEFEVEERSNMQL